MRARTPPSGASGRWLSACCSSSASIAARSCGPRRCGCWELQRDTVRYLLSFGCFNFLFALPYFLLLLLIFTGLAVAYLLGFCLPLRSARYRIHLRFFFLVVHVRE